MSFATPEAFRASLDARIRTTALARGVPMSRVRQVLVFDRFLARVFAVFGDRVIAKGGAVLELRIERARTTRDIDLSVTGDPSAVLPLLRRAGAMELGDFLSFVVEPHAHHPPIGGDGMIYEGQRYRVEGRIARKIYGEPFGVDIAFGEVLLRRTRSSGPTSSRSPTCLARRCACTPARHTLPRSSTRTRSRASGRTRA